ncbi:fructuronate reductase [Arthrobacter stackebrandtii]|uniref:Fructuronate reductase n=1 Tax=Arthrobacter stackebrandtii TaxID=272161 RepID=A0ABS4YYF5_9MICC|nr:fructuronate reductase [Arthrobacter stackebrandtii]PYH00408.1 oxidoreductase [Arthrobacter stackebrandtii]
MTAAQTIPALSRTTANTAPPAPVRIVHLGLGAFHRAHQAWYTQRASDGNEWGIAAFTGRRPDAALALAAQDGLYTLIERGGDGDSFELMTSIVEAHDGADVATLARLVAASTTAMVTLTITEAAYNLAADGTLDAGNPAVQADIAALRAITSSAAVKHDGGNAPAAATAAGRLVQALAARRDAGAGPIAVVSCDNLSNNAIAARAAIGGLADVVDPALGAWIDANVSYVGTSIDRITPRTTDAEIDLVAAECGYADSSPVVTEPFSSWVLSGEFPAGRPDWASAGAVFVDDIEDYENRKLWLLNGAHSLMAYAGQLRGHETVAQALADPACADWVEEFWNEAEANLPAAGLDIPAYRAALRERFSNARIAHHLAQIAQDGSNKLRMRAVPVYTEERAAGRSGTGALRMVAAWVAFVLARHAAGNAVADAAAAADIAAALVLPGGQQLAALVGIVDAGMGSDEGTLAALTGLLEELTSAPAK